MYSTTTQVSILGNIYNAKFPQVQYLSNILIDKWVVGDMRMIEKFKHVTYFCRVWIDDESVERNCPLKNAFNVIIYSTLRKNDILL